MNKKSNIRSTKRVGKSIACLGILILITGGAVLSGCGSGGNKDGTGKATLKAEAVYDSAPDDLQLDKILQKLTGSDIFEGEMAKVSPAAVLESYGLSEAKDDTEIYVSYMSTAAMADEITVIRSGNLKEAESFVQRYIEKRKKSFESYKPEEVKKLEDYLTVAYGDDSGIYILCVCSDKKAALALIEEESVR